MTNKRLRAANQKELKRERDQALADLKAAQQIIEKKTELIAELKTDISNGRLSRKDLRNTITAQAKQIKNIQALPWYKRLPFVWPNYNRGFET